MPSSAGMRARSKAIGRLASSLGLAALLLGHAPAAAARRAELVRRPVASNEAIQELALRVRSTPGGTSARLEKIIDLVFSETNGLGFTYQARPTLTAAQAVTARAGNCLSLVNLVVAIARGAGIDAEYIEVEDFETFYRHRGTVVRTTHIIGGVEIAGIMTYIDFLPWREKTYRQLRPISDQRAAALFYNALASEAILAGDHELAESHFRDAFAIDDSVADTWNNYGILQRRRGDLESAIQSLERAHRLEPRSLPPIENLAGMHRRAGRVAEAERYEALALKERTRNPFFLLHQALEHLDRGELDEAEERLRRARRLAPREPEIYVALGRVELERGNRQAAEKLFREASKRGQKKNEAVQTLLQAKIDRLLATAEPLED